MKNKALRLLRAAAGRYDKICEAWYAHAGEELDLQLFLDMAEDDCLTYLGTQELPPVVTATTLAKLAFVHLNSFIQDREYGVKSVLYGGQRIYERDLYHPCGAGDSHCRPAPAVQQIQGGAHL